MKKVLFILLGCLLSFNVMAQVKAISGLVTDVTGGARYWGKCCRSGNH